VLLPGLVGPGQNPCFNLAQRRRPTGRLIGLAPLRLSTASPFNRQEKQAQQDEQSHFHH
jgi:hypothetical protein